MSRQTGAGRRVLHALWDYEYGELSLWAESGYLLTSALQEGTSRPGQVHPFALGWAGLRECVSETLGHHATDLLESKHYLRLPSAGRFPLPSPPAAMESPRLAIRGLFSSKVAARAWQVETLALTEEQMLGLLVSLPAAPRPRLVYGDDLLFWKNALCRALALVARRKYVPTMGMRFGSDNPEYVATWEPVADDEEAAWLGEAVWRIPPACLALADPGQEEADAPVAIQSFVHRCILAIVHSVTETHMKGQDVASRWSGLPLPQQWLAGLLTNAPTITGRPGAVSGFAENIWGWSREVAGAVVRDASAIQDASEGPSDLPGLLRFRLCLKMEPIMSVPSVDRGAVQEPGEPAVPLLLVESVTGWRFRYALQGEDDPSLIIPASDIWFSEDYTSSPLSESYDATLLRLLEFGSRVLPAIRESLKEQYPTDFVVDPGNLTTFLSSTAPKLAEHNIGLLMPPWWDKPMSKPRVRLKIKDDRSRSAGLLGVSSIVDYDWEVAVGQCSLTLDQFLALVKTKAPLVSARGEWVQFDPDEAEAIVEFFERKGRGRMRFGEAVGLGLGGQVPGVNLPIDEIRAEGRMAEICSRLSALRGDLRVPELSAPNGFSGQLRPYQARGVSWLVYLRDLGFGACLADDMGLGKTVEFLAYLLHAPLEHPGPSLLVCPMSVVGNWEKEITRFAPSLRVIVHHGQNRLSSEELLANLDGAGTAGGTLVITTYGLAQRCQKELSQVNWDCVALDEAQNIKNPATKQARAIKKLPAKHRVALTGTPVENRLSELWSIMDFLNPGYLGTADAFRQGFAIPIEKRRDGKREEVLSRIIRPFVLRRLKSDPDIVPDLPDKIEMKVYCNLTAEQATLYQGVVEDMLAKIGRATGMERRGLILSALTKLKQVCNHPAHFLKDRTRIAGRSGKLARLEEMLEEVIAGGEKALVFTQFAEMGALLQTHLRQRLGCEVLYLHGAVPAGGLGLNLTAANHVFHFDRWWNPAVENQATDRAFRIGQKSDVQVRKLITVGTLEERIDQLIESKKGLAERVIGSGEGWLTELSTAELSAVLTLSRDAVGGADDWGERG